jgi:CxxC-x17-CxxC domain-containing protein
MDNNEVTLFAETNFRNNYKRFGIKKDDRRRHMYFIGKTGMGKSTVLENMIISDIRAGNGVAVVDPHGDLAEKVINYIPSNRVEDVVNINPSDINYPIAFNVVEQVEPHLRHLVASGLVGVFKKLWADSWGPRLEYILRNAVLAILDYPGSTLLGVVRMLSDKKYRKSVVANIQDPVVKSFWQREFSSYADKFATEAVSPIQNKVGQFLSSSLMRNIVGQVKSSIDLREIMDEGKIIIMNLSKGRIGEDNSALLGAMMITKIQLAAMSRVNIPEEDRRDFYLYIDEFQNFSTESFANILSEARKYRLNLIMAHQYIEQLGDEVKAAVFGNVGTLVTFRVGATDAEELVKEFTPTFIEEDIVNLPKYEMYLKLMIDGITSTPFSAKGLRPLTEREKTNNIDKVIRNSREKYANDREVVEDKIMRWHEDEYEENDQDDDSKAKKKNNDEGKFDATCSRCGANTKTPFKPDGIRPVYCKDCLGALKEEKNKSVDERKKDKEKELKKINEDIFRKTFNNNLNNLEKKDASLKDNSFRKEENKQKKQEDKKTATKNRGLSLKDLGKQPVVDFKGRVKKIKQEEKDNKEENENQNEEKRYFDNSNKDIEKKEKNSEDKNIEGKGELKEGEEVNF